MIFKDGEKTVFTIASPYMWDARGEYSRDIKVSLDKTESGYAYTLKPSEDWLEDSSRAYPVTVDPTIQYGDIYTVTDKTCTFVNPLTTSDRNTLVNETFLLRVGKLYGGTEAGSLIHADIFNELNLENARILSAELMLKYYGYYNATNLQINAYKVTTSFSSWGSLTDPIFPSALSIAYNSSQILDYIKTPGTASTMHNMTCTFDISNVVCEWQSGTANCGILLRAPSFPSSGDRLVHFYDSSCGGASTDPKFVIAYRNTNGLESCWTYTTMAAGSYGAAAVNNFNGNVVVAQDIAGADGLRMPVGISLVYNTSGDNAVTNSYCGKGWRTNFHMRMYTSPITNYPYYLVDADGTSHYFYGVSGATEWIDEDGLGYTLTRPGGSTYTITDKDGGTMLFNSSGYLTSINDTSGNHITITYSGTNISSISDGAGRSYTFSYLSGCNSIYRITEPDGQYITFGYDTASTSADLTRKLTSITYPGSRTTSFTYYSDSSSSGYGRLSRVTGADGINTRFTYNSDMRALTIGYYTASGSLNTSYTFDYNRFNTTRITDNSSRSVDYQFNNAGQTVSLVNVQTGQA